MIIPEKTLKQRVEEHLRNTSGCNTDDMTLVSVIWAEDCQKIGFELSEISATQLLHLIGENLISKQQSILRARRDINNKKSDTRGKSYKRTSTAKKDEVIKPEQAERKFRSFGRIPFVTGTGKTFVSKRKIVPRFNIYSSFGVNLTERYSQQQNLHTKK